MRSAARAAAKEAASAFGALSIITRSADCASACSSRLVSRVACAATTVGDGRARLSDQLAAEAWGSRSKMAVFRPRCSATTARWMARVVLPAPPFWLIIANVFICSPCLFTRLGTYAQTGKRSSGNHSGITASSGEPPFRDGVILRVQLHADVVAAEHLGSEQ